MKAIKRTLLMTLCLVVWACFGAALGCTGGGLESSSAFSSSVEESYGSASSETVSSEAESEAAQSSVGVESSLVQETSEESSELESSTESESFTESSEASSELENSSETESSEASSEVESSSAAESSEASSEVESSSAVESSEASSELESSSETESSEDSSEVESSSEIESSEESSEIENSSEIESSKTENSSEVESSDVESSVVFESSQEESSTVESSLEESSEGTVDSEEESSVETSGEEESEWIWNVVGEDLSDAYYVKNGARSDAYGEIAYLSEFAGRNDVYRVTAKVDCDQVNGIAIDAKHDKKYYENLYQKDPSANLCLYIWMATEQASLKYPGHSGVDYKVAQTWQKVTISLGVLLDWWGWFGQSPQYVQCGSLVSVYLRTQSEYSFYVTGLYIETTAEYPANDGETAGEE
ncbi:MAG: hypothetical protein IJV85_05155 [Clostridia bacterium]|nr:hypothetical protein [Clostridia bacterium]